MTKNSLLSVIIIALISTACAGRHGTPISTHMSGDEIRPCSNLRLEMDEIRQKIDRLVPESSKTGKNVALGVGGLFFFPAWFFMDLKNGEAVDLKAYQERYNYLHKVSIQKGCYKELDN